MFHLGNSEGISYIINEFLPHAKINLSQLYLDKLMCVHVWSLQWCITLCNPMECGLPGSSVHGILQARILEWVAMPLLQGIFPTQGLNPGLLCLLHWQAGSLPLVLPGKPGKNSYRVKISNTHKSMNLMSKWMWHNVEPDLTFLDEGA